MKNILAALTLFACASLGQAAIQIETGTSIYNVGAFQGTISYSFTNATTAQLVVSLTNTSPAANGGFITSFAFNNPGHLISNVSLSTTTGLNQLLGGSSTPSLRFKDNLAAAPFGQFDIGASIGSCWHSCGTNVSSGIGVGQTGTWTFNLTGTNLNTLTTQSFINSTVTTSYGPQFMAVRFRGFKKAGSSSGDKIGAAVVPEPSFYSMLGISVAGILLLRRRKANQSV
jgi:hypothetical protein